MTPTQRNGALGSGELRQAEVAGVAGRHLDPRPATNPEFGNLLSYCRPIADGGVLYVEPLYTERISTNPNSSTFPQLSRKLVSVREPRTEGGVRVGYAPPLAEALDQVFGPGSGRVATGRDPARTPAAPPQRPDVPAATADELRKALAKLRAALDQMERAIDAAGNPGR
ncbi:hypothetical protein B8W66_13725 [Mycobacterium decipiens]|uniref:Uncharacterized protein n=1 Tax=Mycobacterium decipiens TaxID=1430326 RepID=A0A1X2LU13_9MYCO|nr:hypothetical protein B8W66_13725 [Mycobacterium decipiens]